MQVSSRSSFWKEQQACKVSLEPLGSRAPPVPAGAATGHRAGQGFQTLAPLENGRGAGPASAESLVGLWREARGGQQQRRLKALTFFHAQNQTVRLLTGTVNI